MAVRPLILCPHCEAGPMMYVGEIRYKVCSQCRDDLSNAPTGRDRPRAFENMKPNILDMIRAKPDDRKLN